MPAASSQIVLTVALNLSSLGLNATPCGRTSSTSTGMLDRRLNKEARCSLEAGHGCDKDAFVIGWLVGRCVTWHGVSHVLELGDTNLERLSLLLHALELFELLDVLRHDVIVALFAWFSSVVVVIKQPGSRQLWFVSDS